MFKIRVDPSSDEVRIASLFGLTGFALEILAAVAAIPHRGIGFSSPVAIAAYATSTAFFVIGAYYLAKSKNRSPAWAGLGLLSLLGWILVAFIEDHSPELAEGGPLTQPNMPLDRA